MNVRSVKLRLEAWVGSVGQHQARESTKALGQEELPEICTASMETYLSKPPKLRVECPLCVGKAPKEHCTWGFILTCLDSCHLSVSGKRWR